MSAFGTNRTFRDVCCVGTAEANIYKPAAKISDSKYIVVDTSRRSTDFAAATQVVNWIWGLLA